MGAGSRVRGAWPEAGTPPASRALEVIALHTAERETQRALRAAAAFATGLTARIRLLAPVVVPFPLSLGAPAVRPEVLAGQLQGLAEETGVECEIDIRLCRERAEALRQALPAGSIVVIGEAPRWWRVGGRRLGRELTRAGHSVVFAGKGEPRG